MSEIVEREEGLFTRHGATRALCIVALAGWLVIVGVFLPLLACALFMPQTQVSELFWRGAPIAIWIMLAAYASFVVLWLWRKCDRCGRRLFAEGRNEFLSYTMRKPENRTWLNNWWVRGMVEPERHHKAARFLGSYRNGALMSMALRGRLRCQWCGHEDGAKPGYVVTGP